MPFQICFILVLALCPAKPDLVWLWHYALQKQLVEGPVVSFFSPYSPGAYFLSRMLQRYHFFPFVLLP